FTKIENEDEFAQASRICEQLISVEDLGAPLPELDSAVTHPELRRAYRTAGLLRGDYPGLVQADRDPSQWLIGHIRYAVHTLAFPESSLWQKRCALYSACLAADTVTQRLFRVGPLHIDWLPADITGPGRFGLTIAPGRRDFDRSLDEDLKVLKAERIDTVVCLLSNDEFHRYGVDALLSRYEALGIEVEHLPTVDGRVPGPAELIDLIGRLSKQLRDGKNVL